MNAVLLTVLATLSGTNGGLSVSDASLGHGGAVYSSPAGECSACNEGGHRCRGGHCGHGHGPRGGWFGMMPQTCYNPTFGCYDGNRHNNRYPAFHGTFYRRPYNYRNVFDYPWHADLHEPTSNFAYNVNEPAGTTTVIMPDPAAPVPMPVPVPAPDTLDQGAQTQAKKRESKIRPTSFSKIRAFQK